jgi:hypothetical protein
LSKLKHNFTIEKAAQNLGCFCNFHKICSKLKIAKWAKNSPNLVTLLLLYLSFPLARKFVLTLFTTNNSSSQNHNRKASAE